MITPEQSAQIRKLGIEFAAEQAAYALAWPSGITPARHKLEQKRDAFFAAVLEVTE